MPRRISLDQIDPFTAAYIEAALWSSNDESDESGGRPLDETYTPADIAKSTLAQMIEDCAQFQLANDQDIRINPTKAGHDFWLTRNGHGAGFWDGDWPEEAGKRLTKFSKKFGYYNLLVGRDGKIHGVKG